MGKADSRIRRGMTQAKARNGLPCTASLLVVPVSVTFFSVMMPWPKDLPSLNSRRVLRV
jgi:hypothetical protein